MPGYLDILREFDSGLSARVVASMELYDLANLTRQIQGLVCGSRLTWLDSTSATVKRSSDFISNKELISHQHTLLMRLKVEIDTVQSAVMSMWRYYLGYRPAIAERGITREVFDERARALFKCYLDLLNSTAQLVDLLSVLNKEITRLDKLGQPKDTSSNSLMLGDTEDPAAMSETGSDTYSDKAVVWGGDGLDGLDKVDNSSVVSTPTYS